MITNTYILSLILILNNKDIRWKASKIQNKKDKKTTKCNISQKIINKTRIIKKNKSLCMLKNHKNQ